MVKSLLVAVCFGMMVSAANAVDVADLMPCKPAAARYCDHSDAAFSIRNLLRCGAILAGLSHRVGEPCRAVLRRYGQL
jgi:hypothetical protein